MVTSSWSVETCSDLLWPPLTCGDLLLTFRDLVWPVVISTAMWPTLGAETLSDLWCPPLVLGDLFWPVVTSRPLLISKDLLTWFSDLWTRGHSDLCRHSSVSSDLYSPRSSLVVSRPTDLWVTSSWPQWRSPQLWPVKASTDLWRPSLTCGDLLLTFRPCLTCSDLHWPVVTSVPCMTFGDLHSGDLLLTCGPSSDLELSPLTCSWPRPTDTLSDLWWPPLDLWRPCLSWSPLTSIYLLKICRLTHQLMTYSVQRPCLTCGPSWPLETLSDLWRPALTCEALHWPEVTSSWPLECMRLVTSTDL